MSRLTILFVAGLIILAGVLMGSAPASVRGESACSASINGVPVDGKTIKVDPNSAATIKVAASSKSAQNFVYLEFLGKRWKFDSGPFQDGEWSGKVPVQKYAQWGVGLYKLVWESRDPEGKIVCKASTSIQIPGFPLGTVTGVAGAVAIALGLTALTLTLKTTINEGARWTIKVVTKGKVERDKERRRLRLKPTISVSQTLLGTLVGLLLSGGTLATLQQTAVSLPTIELGLQLVIPFTVLSLVASWFRLARV